MRDCIEAVVDYDDDDDLRHAISKGLMNGWMDGLRISDGGVKIDGVDKG